MSNNFNQPGVEFALAGAIGQRIDGAGYSDIRTVRLGNTDDPPVYVVPKEDREHPNEWLLYVHETTDSGVELMQVVWSAESGITFDNNQSPILVKIAIPPGEHEHHLMRASKAGRAGYPVPPQVAAIAQAALHTPDRDVFNTIFHSTGLEIGLRAGLIRFGDTHLPITAQVDDFFDLTAYLPATGMDKWVLLGVDSSGTAVYTEGDEFATDDATPLTNLPVDLQADTAYFGRVRLSGGDTDLSDKLTIFPDNLYIGGSTSLPVDDTTAIVQDPADTTKQIRLDAGAIAAGTTRVITMGDRDVDLASGGTFAELSHTHAAADITSGLLAPARVAAEFTSTSTGNIDDLDFGDAPYTLIRMNNASDATIRGLAAGTAGQRVTIVSVGAGNVFLAHENAGSAAANRLSNLLTTANTPLSAAGGGAATYQYDATTQRWRLVSHRQGGFINYTVAWTSTGTQPAIGDGTLIGAYQVDGATLKLVIQFVVGSTTTLGTGVWIFSVPVAQALGVSNVIGPSTDFSASVSYQTQAVTATATTIAFSISATGLITPAVPFAWAVGDSISVYGEYRIV